MISKARIRTFLYNLKSSLWFVPTCMVVASILLAFSLIRLDAGLKSDSLSNLAWVYTGGPEGATAVLSSVASSMVTVAGVVFSITIVAMTLASSQFGPRLLQNFMRDRVNQVVLGTFISTFIYCLLVLRTIRREEEFVPQISVTAGILLAIISLFVLIYFIHHVSSSIQADAVIFKVEKELDSMIDQLFLESVGQSSPENAEDASADAEERTWPIEAAANGYVQAIDEEGVMRLATRHDVALRLKIRPGDFALQGGTLALVLNGEGKNDEARRRIAEELNEQYVIGPQRTPVQDLEFNINQIVEIAIRALSPGINDTFTALTCLDRLGSALSKLTGRELPPSCRFDQSGRLRIIARAFSFEGAAKAAFDLIRQNANVAVVIRLLEVVRRVAHRASREDDLDALLLHARMARAKGESIVREENDRRDILSRYEQAEEMIARRRKGEPDRDDG